MCDGGIHVEVVRVKDGTEVLILDAHPRMLISEVHKLIEKRTGIIVSHQSLWVDLLGKRIQLKPDWMVRRCKMDEIMMCLQVEGEMPEDEQPLILLASSSSSGKGQDGKGKNKVVTSRPY